MHAPSPRPVRPAARRIALGLLLLSAGCASSGALPRQASAAYASVESRLVSARTLDCSSHLSAEGMLSAELECRHELARDGSARVTVRGTFNGRPIDLELTAGGGQLRVQRLGSTLEKQAPPELFAGLVVGFVRMGWLHNVALLAMGGELEGVDGDATSLARVVDLAAGDDLELGGRQRRALTFGVEVGGERAATVVLWIDVESGLPLERWQRVFFPGGEMQVVEVYERIELDGPLDPDSTPR